MKKLTALVLAIIMTLSLSACGGGDIKKLGESSETDVLRVTLENADLTFAIDASNFGTTSDYESGSETISDNYYTADLSEVTTPVEADEGCTCLVVDMTAESLTDGEVTFGDTESETFIKVKYAGKTYEEPMDIGCVSLDRYNFTEYHYNAIILDNGSVRFRCLVNLPTQVEDINEDFELTFTLPCGGGSTTEATYLVTAEDREAYDSREMTVEDAVFLFDEQIGQDYFTAHLDEYPVLNGAEIAAAIAEKDKWNIVKTYHTENSTGFGKWYGSYEFQSDGRIRETLDDGSVGYINKMSWEIQGDSLIFTAGHSGRSNVCEVRKVKDGVYMMISDGFLYAIMGDGVDKVSP